MPNPSSAFRRLDPRRGLWFSADACLPLRPLAAPCEACVSVCPAQAIRVGAAQVALGANCLDCARCAAACPTGALAAPERAAVPAQALSIECRRVRPEIAGAAQRTPCLGGLGLIELLESCLERRERPLELIERGWCRRCAASGGSEPARELLDAVQTLLKALDVPTAWWPRLLVRETAEDLALPLAAEPPPENIARRDLFTRVLRHAAVPSERAGGTADPAAVTRHCLRAAPAASRHRDRLAHAVLALAAARGRRPPADLFPALSIRNDACELHGVCAAACPTGALKLEKTQAGAALIFAAARCVACGLCERQCPSNALRLLPAGNPGEPLTAAPQRLRELDTVCCERCGTAFAEQNNSPAQGLDAAQRPKEMLCRACARSESAGRRLLGMAPA